MARSGGIGRRRYLNGARGPEDALADRSLPEQPVFLGRERPERLHGHLHGGGGLYGKPWKSKEVVGKLKRHTYTQERFSYDIQAYYDKVAKL